VIAILGLSSPLSDYDYGLIKFVLPEHLYTVLLVLVRVNLVFFLTLLEYNLFG
jgi:hypothetical protein